MTQRIFPTLVITVAAIAAATILVTRIDAQQQPPPQQPNEVVTSVGGPGSQPTRLAVPEFLALSDDAETKEAAKTISAVLWADLDFEREYLLIAKDAMRTVPAATSRAEVPFNRWRELDAEEVIIGTVQKTAKGLHVEVSLFSVPNRQSVFGQAYDGAYADRRWLAHTVSDEIHLKRRGVHGVARTKITFNSDRSSERVKNTIESRNVKEIFVCDYDGENQRRVVANGTLNTNSAFSPDGRRIAYTSWKFGPMQILVSSIYEGTAPKQLTTGGENSLPAWSPDGTKIAFASTRDGVPNEIYTMNADGTNLQRLTRNNFIDTSPGWSPQGNSLVFLSDRTGTPELWVMDVDGLGARQLTREGPVDRPTWSPLNEIAYTKRSGSGWDIRILDYATGVARTLTNGQGSNESPSFAPGGRHLAFHSTRAGKEQLFTIGRDGRNLRQLTFTGNNRQPGWSNGPKE